MRIVSLVPSATEALFALGVGDQVVGVTHECDYPVGALDRPRVTRDLLPPGLEADEIDAAVRALTEQGKAIYELDEAALRDLAPDLIVTQALCAVCAVSEADVRKVAEGLPTPPEILSQDPTTLGEVLADIRRLGVTVGAEEAAEALIADAAERIDRVQAAVADAPLVTVAALEWLAPVFAAGHWTPQLIEYAGGIDVLGLAGEHSAQITWAKVRAAQPQVIVVMPCGYGAERAQVEAYTYADELAEVNAPRVVAVDASAYFSRPGPRLVDGLELLAHILHPAETTGVPAVGEPVPVLL